MNVEKYRVFITLVYPDEGLTLQFDIGKLLCMKRIAVAKVVKKIKSDAEFKANGWATSGSRLSRRYR